jgi:hypothetical protein
MKQYVRKFNDKNIITSEIKFSECSQVGGLESLLKLKEENNDKNIFIMCPYYGENKKATNELWSGGDTQSVGSGFVNKNDAYENEYENATKREICEELYMMPNEMKLCCDAQYMGCVKNKFGVKEQIKHYVKIYSVKINNCIYMRNDNVINKKNDIRYKRIGYIIWGTFEECYDYINKMDIYDGKNSDNIDGIAIVSIDKAIDMAQYAKGRFVEYRGVSEYECEVYGG